MMMMITRIRNFGDTRHNVCKIATRVIGNTVDVRQLAGNANVLSISSVEYIIHACNYKLIGKAKCHKTKYTSISLQLTRF